MAWAEQLGLVGLLPALCVWLPLLLLLLAGGCAKADKKKSKLTPKDRNAATKTAAKGSVEKTERVSIHGSVEAPCAETRSAGLDTPKSRTEEAAAAADGGPDRTQSCSSSREAVSSPTGSTTLGGTTGTTTATPAGSRALRSLQDTQALSPATTNTRPAKKLTPPARTALAKKSKKSV